jgi:hypothetical protein
MCNNTNSAAIPSSEQMLRAMFTNNGSPNRGQTNPMASMVDTMQALARMYGVVRILLSIRATIKTL